MKVFNHIIAALFPKTCAVCGAIIGENESLCDYCYEMIERTSVDNRCFKCGLPKKHCACSKYIFRFSGCTAPFYYSEFSKKAMFIFKFRKRSELSEMFARYMALSVNETFYGVDFDLIAYVPMDKQSKFKRGYNQSEVLAKELSKILKLPIAWNLLSARKKKYSQHTLPNKKRHDNVKDKYYCNHRVDGKTILLVDDIKTTGATLDECSLQLLRSGAERVYCVTGLITVHRKKKKESDLKLREPIKRKDK